MVKVRVQRSDGTIMERADMHEGILFLPLTDFPLSRVYGIFTGVFLMYKTGLERIRTD